MESQLLSREVDGECRFWEITWEGCDVEVARWGAGGDDEAQTHRFTSALEAQEFIADELARKRGEGWVDHEGRAPSPSAPVAGLVNPELEAALIEDPGDLEARLVYADWLQAAGDPRGELIALQQALGAEPTPALEQAERAHLERHGEALLGALGDAPQLAELDWHLGFLRAARLFVSGPSERDLDDVSLVCSLLANPSSRLLERLALHKAGRDQWESPSLTEYARAIAESGARPLLRSLQLGLPAASGGLALDSDLWAAAPALEELALFGSIAALGELSLPRLRSLILSQTQDRQVLTSLSRARCPALERLDLGLSSLPARSPAAVEAFFGALRLPALRSLSLDGQGPAEAACLPLLYSPMFSRLEVLELAGTFAGPGVLAIVAQNGGALTGLRRLILRGWYFDDALVEQLSALVPEVLTARGGLHRDHDYEVEGDEDEGDDYDEEYALDEYERRKYGDVEGKVDDREFQMYGYAEQVGDDPWEAPVDEDHTEEDERAPGLDEVWEDPAKEDPFDLDDDL